MKIRKWKQSARDKDVIIELEFTYYELVRFLGGEKALTEKFTNLLDEVADQAEEPPHT